MKRNDFVRFKETLSTAGVEHPIWNMGFMWLDLTEKQLYEIVAICSQHPECRKEVVNGRDCIVTPTGIAMYIIR